MLRSVWTSSSSPSRFEVPGGASRSLHAASRMRRLLILVLAGCAAIKPVVTAEGSVNGVVVDQQTGLAVADADACAVASDSRHSWFGQTDAQGAFHIEDLPAGTYDVLVEKDGYAGASSMKSYLPGSS
jgi:hypothetical protein